MSQDKSIMIEGQKFNRFTKGFTVKRIPDGKALINLGCGIRMHPAWNNLDFSIYARLRHAMWQALILRQVGLISQERFNLFSYIEPDIIVWNLRRGIPFPNQTFDVVYHCHLLEHIDRANALSFLAECYRVLRPGGIIRVVVPDLEKWAHEYSYSLEQCNANNFLQEHEEIIADLLTQLTQNEPTTRRVQKPVTRWLEKVLLGDGEKTGWKHRWMYDHFTLEAMLSRAGFNMCKQTTAWESRIEDWKNYGLDMDTEGNERKPESLYMEAFRPLKSEL